MPDQIAFVVDELARNSEASRLLGGLQAMRDSALTPSEVHQALMRGLPGSALRHLLDHLRILNNSGKRLGAAIGVSLRTIQRKKDDASKRLTVEQAGRLWQLAEVLARATRATGSQEAAERWLEHPAIGLDRKCPIDLLTTPTGVRMVVEYLGRIEYGVYT